MSDELVHTPVRTVAKVDYRTSELERMREKLARFMPRALEILEELAEGAENERVRLSATESILDRAGLGKTQTTQVVVSQAEHDIATNEATELVAKLSRQKELSGPKVKPSIEALIVLEGDDNTLPTSLEGESGGAIPATSSE